MKADQEATKALRLIVSEFRQIYGFPTPSKADSVVEAGLLSSLRHAERVLERVDGEASEYDTFVEGALPESGKEGLRRLHESQGDRWAANYIRGALRAARKKELDAIASAITHQAEAYFVAGLITNSNGDQS